jgi:hypothetical protein
MSMNEMQIKSMVLARVRRLCFIFFRSAEEEARRWGCSDTEGDVEGEEGLN